MNRYKYTFAGLVFSPILVLISASIRFYHSGGATFALQPATPHNRAMFLFVSSLMVAIGYFADRNTRLILAHEEEKRRIFTSAVDASQHILNNFLNNMLYFQQQAKASQALDEKTLKLYDEVIHDAAEQLRKLGEISEISEKSIRETVYPK